MKKDDRAVCKCKKGYACQNQEMPHFGQCWMCWESSLTRREMRLHGVKRRP